MSCKVTPKNIIYLISLGEICKRKVTVNKLIYTVLTAAMPSSYPFVAPCDLFIYDDCRKYVLQGIV